ncbi:MAG TPA: DedA family protein, partial [Gammaproteobacteria bacterium]|nr:DedA family protein [Gammaproteobacteria bacterium]
MSIQSLLHESVPYLANYGLIIAYAGAILEGETVILLVGVLCHQGFLDVDEIVVATALGALTGDQMWFHLGSRYGNGVLARFPRLQRNANRVRPWLEQKSNWVAMACRFVYGTRVIAPLMLGMEKYPSLRFFLINIV